MAKPATLIFLSIASLAAAVEVPDEALRDPAAEAIPHDELQDAAGSAVANGLLAFLERMHAPGNDRRFVFPPIPQRKVVDHEEYERRYKWVTRTRPKYRDTYETVVRLVPKKDEYGHVTGYERKKVRVLRKREKVGEEEYRVLVPDPEGPVVKTRRRPIYGPGGPDLVPAGWYAVNAMALYCFGRAGLGDRQDVQTLALQLGGMVHHHGMPDHTYDLAWLAAGFAQLTPEVFGEHARRYAGKLLDGQIPGRKRGLGGLWGPVCIDHEVVARFFTIEMKLRAKLDELRMAAESGNKATAAQAEKALAKLEQVLDEVLLALEEHTMQGKRLVKITRPYRDGNYEFAGLPYYIYNRVVADVDSTAIAAWALAEVDAAGLLPEETPRSRPGGYRLIRAERSDAVLGAVAPSMLAVIHGDGAIDAHNLIAVNHAYDQVTLQDVPFRGDHGELTRPESWRSQLNGHLALSALWDRASGVARDVDERDAVEARALAALDAVLAADWERANKIPRVHDGETVSAEELVRNRGEMPVPERADEAVEELPLGHAGTPFEVLHAALALHRPRGERETRRAPERFRRLAYRLLLHQGTDGLWGRSRRRGLAQPTGTLAAQMRARERELAERWARQVSEGRKQFEDFDGFDRRRFVAHFDRDGTERIDEDLWKTGSALVYLIDQADRPVPLDDAVIGAHLEAFAAAVAPAVAEAGAEAAEEGAGEEEPPANLPKANDALTALFAVILEKSGKTMPAPPEPAGGEDAAPADEPRDEAAGDEAEGSAEEGVEGADEILDDVLGEE